MSGTSKWSLSVTVTYHSLIHTSPPHTWHMPRPCHIILLELITRILGEPYKSLSSSLSSLLQSPVASSLLGPNVYLSSLCQCYSSSVKDQGSNPHETTGQIIVLVYLSVYIFRIQMGKQKIQGSTVAGIPWVQSALLFFVNGTFIC
jgi:hypothetical protein